MLLLPQTLERTRRVCPAVNVTAQAGVETVRVWRGVERARAASHNDSGTVRTVPAQLKFKVGCHLHPFQLQMDPPQPLNYRLHFLSQTDSLATQTWTKNLHVLQSNSGPLMQVTAPLLICHGQHLLFKHPTSSGDPTRGLNSAHWLTWLTKKWSTGEETFSRYHRAQLENRLSWGWLAYSKHMRTALVLSVLQWKPSPLPRCCSCRSQAVRAKAKTTLLTFKGD